MIVDLALPSELSSVLIFSGVAIVVLVVAAVLKGSGSADFEIDGASDGGDGGGGD